MSTILVIEDDAELRGNLLDLLEAEGFDGLCAADAEAGVRLAIERAPDLVLCDLSLRSVDGFDALTRLRQGPVTGAIPVVVVSGRAERSDIDRALALGANDYVTKPFDRVRLLDVIRARINRNSSLPMAERGASDVEEPVHALRPGQSISAIAS
ncbi:MAG: response regulator transcription factor [Polyangiales bacterium]